jgi:hypothetical protein
MLFFVGISHESIFTTFSYAIIAFWLPGIEGGVRGCRKCNFRLPDMAQ